ncbi:putative uncharacterized domain protein (plasmid) [Borreliella bissettiae DN127]|uniref:Uncharacterized domain protein n=1 Tax=Borrelia bissettiae (strain DSM 17990 / CIP 109136 / DN127) TaxID=521010 RepID=G0AP98_BORBD|nr:putative uncharacterized domain protein [Borreliella bissettiae DN127]
MYYFYSLIRTFTAFLKQFFSSEKFSKEYLSLFKAEISNFSRLSFLGYRKLIISSKASPSELRLLNIPCVWPYAINNF